MKSLIVCVGACLVGASSLYADSFDPPSGYYSTAEGKSGVLLAGALHDIIDNHTIIPYSWPPYQDLDESPLESDKVVLIYSGITRAKNLNGGSVGDWNREHIWPKSFGVGSGGADTSDVVNLRPADVQVNSERGSLYFDNTDPATSIPLQFEAPGSSKDLDSWEPRDVEKGDIARSCFYMAVRYDGSDSQAPDLKLSDTPNAAENEFGKLLTLLQWHREDPVSAEERQRNQGVYDNYQGNRNPFIDRPEFAELVFLERYPSMDADADGILDFWEWTKVGHDGEDVDSDTDEDEIPLLAEFAMLGDPTKPDAEKSPILYRSGGDFLFEYRRNRAATNLNYVVEETSIPREGDAGWDAVSDFTSVSVVLNTELEVVTLTIPHDAEDKRRFFRLRLELVE